MREHDSSRKRFIACKNVSNTLEKKNYKLYPIRRSQKRQIERQLRGTFQQLPRPFRAPPSSK